MAGFMRVILYKRIGKKAIKIIVRVQIMSYIKRSKIVLRASGIEGELRGQGSEFRVQRNWSREVEFGKKSSRQ
jgi:hypothetical protein